MSTGREWKRRWMASFIASAILLLCMPSSPALRACRPRTPRRRAKRAMFSWLAPTAGWRVSTLLMPFVRHFQNQGKSIVLLSGDRHAVAQQVADRLGIPTALGDCLPDSKLSFVQRLQQGGAIVAMIGDGVNDAAVLRAADVSFAMGGGATLAQTQADCVLLSGTLSALAEADRIADQTISVIRQNLCWAVCYNMVAIPAAASGWLNPWMSGIGMSLSSIVVVLNALRLRRVRATRTVERGS